MESENHMTVGVTAAGESCFIQDQLLQIPAKVKSYFNSVVQQGFASNFNSCMSLIQCCNEDERLKEVFVLIFEMRFHSAFWMHSSIKLISLAIVILK